MGTDEAVPGSGELPERQTWHPARRRSQVILFSIASAIMVLAAVVLALTHDGAMFVLPALFAVQSAIFAAQAWFHTRNSLEADATGLHHVVGRKRTTVPWKEITEIRPSIAKGPPTFLVAVREGRPTVDLPLTEEHLDELRRWHAAARSGGEGPSPVGEREQGEERTAETDVRTTARDSARRRSRDGRADDLVAGG